MAMNMAIPYAFALLAVERGVARRTCLFVALGILIIATAVTLSRGGFIGLAAVLAVLWMRSPRKLVSMALVIVMALALVMLAPASTWTEVTHDLDIDERKRHRVWAPVPVEDRLADVPR